MASKTDLSNHPTNHQPTNHEDAAERGVNLAIVRGRLSRPPRLIELPSGDRLARLDVTVRRAGAPAETVPVQVDDPPASVLQLDTDDEIVAVGIVRRRYYRAGGATASQTEVVAAQVLPATHLRRITKAVTQAMARVETALSLGVSR